jgi:hypothetical protein
MTEYELKENETLIMQSKIMKEDELLNIVTVYKNNDSGEIFIHNSNGVEQKICPYLRSCGLTFYCEKYLNSSPSVPPSSWISENQGLFCTYKNPSYKNCEELGFNPEQYQECGLYSTIILGGK